MRPTRIFALPLLCPLAAAQLSTGELLVATYGTNPGGSTLVHLGPDGSTILETTVGTGAGWVGTAPTSSGRIAVGRQFPAGVNLVDPATLDEVATWDTGGEAVADVEVFPDGALVVADHAGAVRLYDEVGNVLGSIAHPEMTSPVGFGMGADGVLWVTDFGNHRVMGFDVGGTQLASFYPGFFTSDVAPDPDGSLWLVDTGTAAVHHVTSQGTPISSFPTAVPSSLAMGVARGTDGTLWVSSFHAATLFRYSATGALLDGVSPNVGGGLSFLRVVEPGFGPGTPLCFGDGSGLACPCANDGAAGSGCADAVATGATLTAYGTPSVSSDSLSLTAANVVNAAGLFFQGELEIAGGSGQVFGDGIRCCGGAVVRLQVVDPPGSATPATARMTESVTANGPPGTVRPGDEKCYQFWYRSPGAASACGNGFNLTNALRVAWLP